MSLSRAFVSAGAQVARQRLVAVGGSRSFASFSTVGRTASLSARPVLTLLRSFSLDRSGVEGDEMPRSRPSWRVKTGEQSRDAGKHVVKDRIYVGNLPMGFTEEGLRELVPGLTPSSVEMGVPKPKATTAHGFLNFASLDESEAALAVILSQTRDAGQLVALYAGRPKTPEALERDQQRKAKHVEKAAAYEAEMAAWRRQVWPPSKTVRIAGLWGISDERLVKVIVSVLEGTPSELLRGKHQDTNQLHEYANVHFQSIEDATAALEKLRMAGLGERLRPGVEVDFARNHHAWKNIPKPQPMAWMNKKYGGGRPSGSDGGFRRSSNPDSGYRRPSVSEGGYRLSSGSEVGYRSPSKIGGRTTPQRKGNFGLKD